MTRNISEPIFASPTPSPAPTGASTPPTPPPPPPAAPPPMAAVGSSESEGLPPPPRLPRRPQWSSPEAESKAASKLANLPMIREMLSAASALAWVARKFSAYWSSRIQISSTGVAIMFNSNANTSLLRNISGFSSRTTCKAERREGSALSLVPAGGSSAKAGKTVRCGAARVMAARISAAMFEAGCSGWWKYASTCGTRGSHRRVGKLAGALSEPTASAAMAAATSSEGCAARFRSLSRVCCVCGCEGGLSSRQRCCT
mmetsp:Transcript_60649/g.198455  ORF Transcript_60649/g.198455 Transcript_60649/m.198455 type:complete len:258 (-) Transcript_60649:617-1390(-)